jgi:cbb3-type cytochrome oxidase maturation protein
MIVIFLLIPLGIITAGVFLICFFWAVRSGQYEDTCTPAMRILSEETEPKQSLPSKEQKTGDGRNL